MPESVVWWDSVMVGSKVVVSLGIIVGTVASAIFWMQSTFAEATEMVEVRASIVQMQINSARKELRGLKRDLRKAAPSEKDYITNDLDAVNDELATYKEKRDSILNEH